MEQFYQNTQDFSSDNEWGQGELPQIQCSEQWGRSCTPDNDWTNFSIRSSARTSRQLRLYKLSAQELINCDGSQYGCDGGYVNKVLNWGRKKGYITEECMAYNGKLSECDVDHFETNECRVDNQIYKITDYCISIQEENIKREIFKFGPVVS